MKRLLAVITALSVLQLKAMYHSKDIADVTNTPTHRAIETIRDTKYPAERTVLQLRAMANSTHTSAPASCSTTLDTHYPVNITYPANIRYITFNGREIRCKGKNLNQALVHLLENYSKRVSLMYQHYESLRSKNIQLTNIFSAFADIIYKEAKAIQYLIYDIASKRQFQALNNMHKLNVFFTGMLDVYQTLHGLYIYVMNGTLNAGPIEYYRLADELTEEITQDNIYARGLNLSVRPWFVQMRDTEKLIFPNAQRVEDLEKTDLKR